MKWIDFFWLLTLEVRAIFLLTDTPVSKAKYCLIVGWVLFCVTDHWRVLHIWVMFDTLIEELISSSNNGRKTEWIWTFNHLAFLISNMASFWAIFITISPMTFFMLSIRINFGWAPSSIVIYVKFVIFACLIDIAFILKWKNTHLIGFWAIHCLTWS